MFENAGNNPARHITANGVGCEECANHNASTEQCRKPKVPVDENQKCAKNFSQKQLYF
jgi:hypothetical protein